MGYAYICRWKGRILAALDEPRTAAGVLAVLVYKYSNGEVSDVTVACATTIYNTLTRLVQAGHVVRTSYKHRAGYTFARVHPGV